jgi:NADH:ubiquinone oxidoreductase subunit F (NADH-binding)
MSSAYEETDAESADTAIVTVTDGDASRTVEVPAGVTLGALVNCYSDKAGIGRTAVRAVLFGGPAGVFIPVGELYKTTLREAAENAGAFRPMLLHVLREDDCAVEAARDAMRFLHGQSCGKCVFCREGTLHLAAMLGDIESGEGRTEDLNLMEELGRQMSSGCVCALGSAAAGTLLTSLGLFREEYEQHIRLKKCPVQRRGGGGNG